MIGRTAAREEGAPDIDCESFVDILLRVVSSMVAALESPACLRLGRMSRRSPEMPAVLLGKLVRAVSGGEICRYGVRTTPACCSRDNTIGCIHAAAVCGRDLGARPSASRKCLARPSRGKRRTVGLPERYHDLPFVLCSFCDGWRGPRASVRSANRAGGVLVKSDLRSRSARPGCRSEGLLSPCLRRSRRLGRIRRRMIFE